MTTSDLEKAKIAFSNFNQLSGLELMNKLMREGDQSPMAEPMQLSINVAVNPPCMRIMGL